MRSERATTVVSDLTGDDTHPADAAARAEQQVVEVAAAAGVRVLALDDPGFHHAAATVLQQIWSYQAGVPLPPEMLRAFVFTGNYVGAVFDGSQLVGVASAFRTDHGGLHSHIAGVLPSHQGRSIGYLLKLHQRAWALRRGIWSIAWTFDPLIRRNAHFNLIKLGSSGLQAKGYARIGHEKVVGDMPPFSGVVSDDEAWKLLAYIRSKYAGDPALRNW